MKNVKLLVLIGLLSSSVTAQSSYQEPKLPKVSGNVNLTVWSWVPNLDKTVKEFEKIYPNIKVKVENLGGGPATYTKLQTALKAGSGAPDVVQIEYGYLPSFIDTGGLADLTKYGANEARNLFVPWTWGQVSPDGKSVYAIPQDTGPFAMVYRKDIFDKYKIAVPKTWNEYAKAAEQLSKASGGKVKMGNFYSTFSPWFIALAWQDGGQFFKRSGDGWVQTLDNSSAKKVLNYWNGLIKKGYVSTVPAFSADYWNAAGAGQIATNFEAAWGPGGYASSMKTKSAGQWRVASLPQWKAGASASGNWGGSSMAVTTQSKNPQAAAAFALWLNSSRTAVETNFKGGGLFPAAKAGLKLPALSDKTSPPIKFFGGQDINAVYAKASEGVNVNFQWAPWFPAVDANFNKQIDAMLKGKLTPDQALAAWQKESLDAARKDGYTVR
ncbi:ABC transporter substrate-binding protein [Deinococcus yavapaiensis]|uniref:Multiple sugar transport system substrate-binding protein n=1 Tax=Deinococcus yavapaiensis KR-236 TaxID=694435 RepID=A0A318SDE2_9DEIO|nr:sugar ABC transporter substrate-binding protein [Deinococcus yavapaiensis]PYE54469.1 multiple sugar transport system substrate-binding protein [Deinococcus yavapaiensis KR-236]